MVKLNILLYPGETRHTLDETLSWLRQHQHCFQGVSANPVILYPHETLRGLPKHFAERGATLVSEDQLVKYGYADLNLSHDFPHEQALEACLEVSREFMTMSSYFDIKKFGYFSPALTWDDFRSAAQLDDPRQLPFAVGVPSETSCREHPIHIGESRSL